MFVKASLKISKTFVPEGGEALEKEHPLFYSKPTSPLPARKILCCVQ